MHDTNTVGQTDVRAQLHGMWTAVAPAWGEHAEDTDRARATITERMLALAAPRSGQRVLELACGAGGVGLAAAELVAPGGEVVLSDVVEEMTTIAAARAENRGLHNVTTAVLDLENIDQPDESFDVVVCREGLMFAPDPIRAARELHRVLRPGGRVAIAVWGPRASNPWLGILLDAVSEQLGAPVPPPGVPGPFSLDDPGRLTDILSQAGLAEVTASEVPVPLRLGSIDEWWTRTSALAGPVSRILDALPSEATQAIAARACAAATDYETPDGLEFPGLTLLAGARRV
jgi:SAM-dependent methyltransferase